MPKLILASKSPRRKELLEQIGVDFTIVTSDKEEVVTSNNPETVVKELSLMKALDVAQSINYEAVILGTDTVVANQNQILGKPKDEADAKRMLEGLQNQMHEVYSGVALIIKQIGKPDKVINFSVCTRVGVGPMTEKQIENYVATKEPSDKAGAYAIQGKFAIYINKLEGDYYNVVGLPIAKIYEVLLENGIDLLELE